MREVIDLVVELEVCEEWNKYLLFSRLSLSVSILVSNSFAVERRTDPMASIRTS